jgi:hypothetical protein
LIARYPAYGFTEDDDMVGLPTVTAFESCQPVSSGIVRLLKVTEKESENHKIIWEREWQLQRMI